MFTSLFGSQTDEEIGKAVLKSIESFDQSMLNISNLLSFGLNDNNYNAFYNIANDISIAIGGVCLAIAVICTYMAMVKEGLTLRGDWKKIVTILLKLAITKGLIDTATQFMTWIYSFPAKITQITIDHTTNKQTGALSKLFNPLDIAAGLGITPKSGMMDRFVALQYGKILGLVFFFLTIAIYIIAIARILKIYTLLAFSSVAFSKIPLYGFEGCKGYVKEMCALGLQGAIIATTVCLFEVANVSMSKIIGNVGGTWGSFGSIMVLGISMCLLIFKSEELARKVI